MPIPNSLELIHAVRSFLETEAAPDLSPRKAFHAKVAANVLAILEREIKLQPMTHERHVYAKLLGHDGTPKALRQELSAALRSGSISETTPGVLDALIDVATQRLAVDNPDYATYRRLIGDKDI